MGTKLLGFSIGRGSGAPKGLTGTWYDRYLKNTSGTWRHDDHDISHVYETIFWLLACSNYLETWSNVSTLVYISQPIKLTFSNFLLMSWSYHAYTRSFRTAPGEHSKIQSYPRSRSQMGGWRLLTPSKLEKLVKIRHLSVDANRNHNAPIFFFVLIDLFRSVPPFSPFCVLPWPHPRFSGIHVGYFLQLQKGDSRKIARLSGKNRFGYTTPDNEMSLTKVTSCLYFVPSSWSLLLVYGIWLCVTHPFWRISMPICSTSSRAHPPSNASLEGSRARLVKQTRLWKVLEKRRDLPKATFLFDFAVLVSEENVLKFMTEVALYATAVTTSKCCHLVAFWRLLPMFCCAFSMLIYG